MKSTQENSAFDPAKNKLEGDLLTPENIWRLGQVGGPSVSPDGQTIAFTVTYTNIGENRKYSDIYTLDIKSGEKRRLTFTAENEYSVAWTPDGERIAYLATKQSEPQVWTMKPDGTDAKQLTSVEGGIDGFVFSPDGLKMAVVKRVLLDETMAQRHPDMPLANVRLETDLMYRHWNDWADGKYNHVLLVDLATGATTDIMEGEKFHSPLMPFGGTEQIAWTADSKAIAYTCKKLSGKASALSTNSNIYLYDIENKTTRNLTENNAGYDMNPIFSPDGKFMLHQSMARDGYESDKNRIILTELATGKQTELTEKTENGAISVALDSNVVYFSSEDKGRNKLFKLDIATKEISVLNDDICDYGTVVNSPGCVIACRQSMKYPTEIYAVDKATGEARNLSNVNTEALAGIKMGNIEEVWVPATDGKEIHTWVLFPPDFDASKKYPALLFCEGGPQNMVSQFWSLRWNMELMASNGYIVVAPNRRGVPGFGREWVEQISGDYGGQNMKDYLSAIDYIAAKDYVDEERLGAVGASYGGFSVYWLAGHHEKRFKAFIAHCGIFNFDQQYCTTEEMFFENWDMKGPFWDKSNAAAQECFKQSPHLFVQNWDTPILVIHGEKDFRIPYTQGMGAFNAAVLRNIPAEFLYFPDECHWVSTPQNSIVWHREFYRWLDKWLK